MDLHSPLRDPRRLSFNTNTYSTPGIAQSPYAPSSKARSSTQQHPLSSYSVHNALQIVTPEPSEEAESFVGGGLKSEMRAISLRAVAVARKAINAHVPHQVALNFAMQIVEDTKTQLALSETLYFAPTIRPSTRRHMAALREHLTLEVRTWSLLHAAWAHPKSRSTDLVTRRLRLPVADGLRFSELRGVASVQLVVQWLENAAAADLTRSGGPAVTPLEDPAYRWRYTARRFDDEPVSIDFPLRGEDDPLTEVERKAEARLAREIFRLIRAGMPEEAERICRDAGQPWRAAAISGGQDALSLSSNGVTGSARCTWRRAAAALATSTHMAVSKYERAVAAVLSGVVQPVLAVCTSYDDQLWARLSVLLDDAVQKMLSNSEVAIEDDVILKTFRECKFSTEGATSISGDVLLHLRHVQAYLALGADIRKEHQIGLLDSLANLAKSAVEQRLEWPCRLAVQICLFLKFSGRILNTEEASMLKNFDLTVQLYVQSVIEGSGASHEDPFDEPFRQFGPQEQASICTVAANFLAEMADVRNALDMYSRLMQAALRADLVQEKIEARRAKVATQHVEDRRVLCLEEAASCFTSEALLELALQTVKRVWCENFEPVLHERPASPSHMQLVEPSTSSVRPDKDEMVSRAIEFLTYSGFPNYPEALVRTTYAVRRFFLLQKRETARRLIAWFPRDVLERLQQGSHGKYVQEFLCWELYFQAVSCHNDWHVYKTSNRPATIPESVRLAAVTEPFQKEAKEKLQVYNTALSDYEKVCEDLKEAAVRSLYEALLVENGWMSNITCHSNIEGEEDTAMFDEERERHSEMDALRKCGVPEMVSLLHNVLHRSGMYKEAVEIGTLVAREEFKLYLQFKPAEMKSLLAKVAESAIKLVDDLVVNGNLKPPYLNTFFEDFGASEEACRRALTTS